MKTRIDFRRYQFLFTALFFAAQTWSSLREKAVVDAVLYSIALVASLFLSVLILIWGAKKPKRVVGEEEHQEETSL